jgi:hypothetical protein
MSSTNFDLAYDFTKRWEGGYVFDKDDPGGETNKGITDRRDGKTDGKIDIDGDGTGDVGVKALTDAGAKAVYHRAYWVAMGCDNLPVSYGVAVFDTAVNCGISRTTLWLETSKDHVSLLEHRRQHYESLVQKKPVMKKFLKGWMNRLFALHKYIASLEANSLEPATTP